MVFVPVAYGDQEGAGQGDLGYTIRMSTEKTRIVAKHALARGHTANDDVCQLHLPLVGIPSAAFEAPNAVAVVGRAASSRPRRMCCRRLVRVAGVCVPLGRCEAHLGSFALRKTGPRRVAIAVGNRGFNDALGGRRPAVADIADSRSSGGERRSYPIGLARRFVPHCSRRRRRRKPGKRWSDSPCSCC